MKHINYFLTSVAAIAISVSFTACSDDDTEDFSGSEAKYIGQAVGNFTADEWYPGGQLGTTESIASNCYSDESPATEQMGLMTEFFTGEQLFEKPFSAQKPFWGLGPASVRRSCIDCHPNYGHGQRFDSYKTEFDNGNGYLLVVYHPNEPGSNDGGYISEVTGMPQTQAVSPFLPPIDESKIQLEWKAVTEMESGLPMKFPDGEEYSLIYPELYIPETAFNTSPRPSNLAFRLESTIGIIGTGLLDAIPEDSIKAQYAKTAAYYKSAGVADVSEYVNSNFWNASTNDFASGAWYTLNPGQLADGSTAPAKMVKRFTYALTRATLQDGPGANAIWNITNVSRPDRPKLYTTSAWAKAMSENVDVRNAIAADPTSPYYANTDDGIKERVLNLLDPSTNQFDNQWHNFTPEMTNDQFYALMVWHRGLAIPRARNLNDTDVQRGKKLFMEMGCANCHRPSWTTGDDNYWTPECMAGKPLPRYPNQKIYPYSDMMQHKLYMKNDIHGSWCRTTPLWGRGLSMVNTGAEDRLHDCRARNEVEAIMWHAYSKNSHAYQSALKFYNLSKSDRDAVVKFLRSI